MIDARFSLIDHDGGAVTNDTYRGRHVIVFFGFTHCRVVCPRALSRISRALELLGSAADEFVPLYISVDPERDTPAVMKTFLEKYPRFIGLTGPREEIDATKKAFRVFAQKKSDATEPDGYVIPHTALTYLLDPNGDYLTHFADTIDELELATHLRKITASGVVASA